ncbi:MAG TPA: heavy metal sensor histidine kinase [Herpetosiphonaceae bacterium]
MKIQNLSLRWRLTALYVALLAGVLILFSLAVYVALSRSLAEADDDALQNLALLLDSSISTRGGKLRIDDSNQTAKGHDRFVRLYNNDGEAVFDNSTIVGEVALIPGGLLQAKQGRERFETVAVEDQHFRVLSVPIQRNDEIKGVLQVAQLLDEAEQTLDRLLLILATTIPVMLVVASWGGAFLAGRALLPIDRLTRAAQRISAHDLSERLGAPARNDELGRLSLTFDSMIARLERAFRQQRQFTADASHELRTPLTALRGQIEVALSQPRSTAEYRSVLESALSQTERMSRLVSSLLTLARADAATLPLHYESLDLADLVTDVAEQMQPLADERKVRLEVHADSVPLLIDQDRLLQVLLNLLDNALNHTPAGGSVSIACSAQDKHALVTVRDTGMGIAAEHLPHIFDRFYRVDTARSRERGGTGLGLAIAQMLIEAHGGLLSVESEPGAGSTFTIRLPLRPAQAAPRELPGVERSRANLLPTLPPN